MPRKLDNDTRVHFRTYEDENHAQKRAFCLHCQKDACADNIQRMKNHLLKCEAYLSSQSGGEPVFQLQMDGPVAPDTPMAGMAQPHAGQVPPTSMGSASASASVPPDGVSGPSHTQDSTSVTPSRSIPPSSTAATTTTTTNNNNNNNSNSSSNGNGNGNGGMMGTPTTSASAKATQNSLNNVRMAMARSTKRLTDLEAVLKTQVQDGMHNAATHVRAAIRDERDRLFKLSQTLVKQETRVREAQNSLGTF